jgi:ring-1,2-phenylacetyl-CoA epoxidase subunit PaaC
MVTSTDPTLAALAAKSVKETAYHLRHSRGWVLRLGDGTSESNRRAQEAVDALWRFTGELFETDDVERAMIADGVAADPDRLADEWRASVTATLHDATLVIPEHVVMQSGGRTGSHSEVFSYMIGEMQVVARSHPGARW